VAVSTGEPYDTERILTLPNVLSFVRLLGVPLFLWLLAMQYDLLAVIALAFFGATDWVDGYIARKYNQRSKLGQVLDPAADRLYILATLIGLAMREIIPWWLVILLLARDVLMAAVVLPLLRTRGFISLPVHFLGKTATFCLLYAFPMVLLGASAEPWGMAFRVIGWAIALWGALLYWCAGLMYFGQTLDVLRRFPRIGKDDRPSTTAAVTGSG
jgi:cardiolipin synthase (CMP-forming)